MAVSPRGANSARVFSLGQTRQLSVAAGSGWFRRILSVPALSGGGRLTERTPAVQPRRWERLKVPHCGRSSRSAATAQDAPLRHSFDAYFGRIIGSHMLSFARTMCRRRGMVLPI